MSFSALWQPVGEARAAEEWKPQAGGEGGDGGENLEGNESSENAVSAEGIRVVRAALFP